MAKIYFYSKVIDTSEQGNQIGLRVIAEDDKITSVLAEEVFTADTPWPGCVTGYGYAVLPEQYRALYGESSQNLEQQGFTVHPVWTKQ